MVCNHLVNDGPEVRYLDGPETAPTPMGGTILDGMYELTAITLYGVSQPAPDTIARAVFQFAGTTIQQVGELDGAEQKYTSKFAVSGTVLTIDDTCPKPNRDQPAFTATSTDLRFFIASGGGTLEMVLTKR